MFLLLALQLTTSQATLRGTVVSAETHEPINLSIVTLSPNVGKQFTDPAGKFAFVAVRPGTYRVSVRQIGYVPLDTVLTLRANQPVDMPVLLQRLAIELPPITITAPQCTAPGPPDSNDAAFAAVFEQLQENAHRFALLADSFPFQYVLEFSSREVTPRGDTSRPTVRTIRFTSKDDRPYRPGRVVERAWGPWGSPDTLVVIHDADLEVFGNPAFLANHCFQFAGHDTVAGHPVLRIDFQPSARLGSADMAGSAFLDARTFELRLTETFLTRPDRSALRDVRAMHFRTTFQSIAPGIPLQHSSTIITTYRTRRPTRIETQRTLDIRFRRPPPQ